MQPEARKKTRRSAAAPTKEAPPPAVSFGAKIRGAVGSTFGQALVGAALLWLALPPMDLWPLAWIAPIFWLLLIRRRELAGRRPYRGIWLAGFFFWLAAYHWLRLPHWATSFGWVALAFYLSFYLPVFIGLSRVAVHRLGVPLIVAAPTIWTGLELARAHLLTGITMGDLGHTQYRWISLIQVSDLAGAFAVSFVVMFVAACLARGIPFEGQLRCTRALIPGMVVLAAVLAYGYVRTSGPQPAPSLRVALIQGSIDSILKYDPSKRDTNYDHYRQWSRTALQQAAERNEKVDLMVWPETMLREPLLTYDADAGLPPGWKMPLAEFRQRLPREAAHSAWAVGQLAAEMRVPMIVGLDEIHYAADRIDVFNAAALLSPTGEVRGTYDKQHLVMFGEYVPWADRFPLLQRLTPLPMSLDAGRRPAAFAAGGLRFSPNICYESVLSHVIRRHVNELARAGREPDVLMNLTNDGWFWGSSELDMHLACGVFRAVECRKPFLVAANTGFSAWIDADGRIRARGPRHAPGVVMAQVGRDPRRSWYLAMGDWPAGLCLAFAGVVAMAGVGDRWRRWRNATPLKHFGEQDG